MTYARPAKEAAKAASNDDGERRSGRGAAGRCHELLAAFVGDEVDGTANGVADWSG